MKLSCKLNSEQVFTSHIRALLGRSQSVPSMELHIMHVVPTDLCTDMCLDTVG